MHTRGTIFHHADLVFHNGHTGNKYLILLNTPSGQEPFLFVKTTSRKKNKTTATGCQIKDSLFFIPKGTTFFKLDTWVQLFEPYRFDSTYFENTPNLNTVGSISVGAIDEIVKCFLKTQADDLSPRIKKLLQPPIQDSLAKLQARFNKK